MPDEGPLSKGNYRATEVLNEVNKSLKMVFYDGDSNLPRLSKLFCFHSSWQNQLAASPESIGQRAALQDLRSSRIC